MKVVTRLFRVVVSISALHLMLLGSPRAEALSGYFQPASGVPTYKKAAGGFGFSVALKDDGTVWASGVNGYAELGNGTYIDSAVPVQTLINEVVDIAVSPYHCLAIRRDRSAWAWGLNHLGELGNGLSGFYRSSSVPIKVLHIEKVEKIAVALYQSLAIANGGFVYMWGGDGFNPITTPVLVPLLTNAIDIATNGNVHFAVLSDGTVWTWEDNSVSFTPHKVQDLDNVVEVSANLGHLLALKSDGTVWDMYVPTNAIRLVEGIPIPGVVKKISTGIEFFLALTVGGDLYSWGTNFFGELGQGNDRYGNFPAKVLIDGVENIGTGGLLIWNFTIIVNKDGTVWASGSNFYGEFGLGRPGFSTTTPVLTGY